MSNFKIRWIQILALWTSFLLDMNFWVLWGIFASISLHSPPILTQHEVQCFELIKCSIQKSHSLAQYASKICLHIMLFSLASFRAVSISSPSNDEVKAGWLFLFSCCLNSIYPTKSALLWTHSSLSLSIWPNSSSAGRS